MKTRHAIPWMILMVMGLLILACNLPFSAPVIQEPPAVGLDGGGEQPPEPGEEVVEPPTTEPPPPPPEEPTPTATMPPPTDTPEPPPCTTKASFVADVTYPDDSEVESDTAFIKTWRLQNDGTCTWNASYALVYSHGDQMSGPPVVPLMGPVAPGGVVDISVNLVSPVDSGTYQGFWKLRSEEGFLFGVGTGGTTAFWVKIVVPSDEIVFTPPILIEMEPVIPLLLYVASGTDVVVHDNNCYDLDTGASVSCGSPEGDFRYDHSMVLFIHEYEIDPIHGARFRYFGTTQPTSADCQALTMSSGAFELKNRYYCYKTGAGKYGWIRIKNFTSSIVLFDFGTYSVP